MMEKENNFIDLLNDIDAKLISEAGQAREQKPKRRIWSGSRTVRAACAGLIIVAATVAALHPAVNAEIKNVFSKIGTFWQTEKDLRYYKNELNLTKEEDGITMSVSEAVAADHKVYVYLKMNTEIADAMIAANALLWHNYGEEFDCESVYTPQKDEDGSWNYVVQYAWDDVKELQDVEKVKIEIPVYKSEEEKEDFSKCTVFDFTFSVETQKAGQQKLYKEINQLVEFDEDKQLILKDITINDVNSKIAIEFLNMPEEGKDYYLIGSDSEGNQFTYSAYYRSKEELKTFGLADNSNVYFETAIDGPYSQVPSADAEWIRVYLGCWKYGSDRPLSDDNKMLKLSPGYRIYLK